MAAELQRARVDLDGLLRVLGENLYSTPEVAVRELVQNAHDSCVRRTLEDPGSAFSPEIRVTGDPGAGTLTIADNGAGLTHDEIEDYLATLGAGYTRLLRDRTGDDALIGAFGLGFLSAYVVADRVVVTTSSYREPDRGWQFSSRDGQRYTVDAIGPREVGTEVVLHLREAFADLARPGRLGPLLDRYCCMLPLPVFAGASAVPVNAERAPWEGEPAATPFRQRLAELAFARRFEPVFEPLCTIPLEPVAAGGLDAHGVLWVQDAATYGTSDNRHVSLFVRGMLITDDARRLLPEWAGFAGGVIACDALVPTASREDVQKDATYHRLASHVAETLIGGLARVAEAQPEAWRRVLLRHNEALLGAALSDPRLFALLRDELTVPTTEGDLTLREVVQAAEGRVVISVGDASGYEEVLFRALSRPVVQGIRFGAAAFARRYAEVLGVPVLTLGTTQGDEAVFPRVAVDPAVRGTLQELLGDEEISVRPTRFQPASLPVVIVPDREAALKRRIEDDEADGRMAAGILGLARRFTQRIEAEHVGRLYVNLDAPLIDRLLALDGPAQRRLATLLRALADLTGRTQIEGLQTDLAGSLERLSGALLEITGPDRCSTPGGRGR